MTAAQNTGSRRLLGIFVAGFLAACASGQAKCPRLFIYLAGQVDGAASPDDRIAVEVSPDSNSVRQPIEIEDGDFEARVAFDTTRSGGRFHHDCSRRPSTVTVRLLNGDEELDRVTLSIQNDFIEDEEGDYRASSPIELERQKSQKP